jgi:hypothetical protein
MEFESADIARGIFDAPASTTIIAGVVDSPDTPPDEVIAVTLQNSVSDADIVDLVRADKGPPPPMAIERKRLIYEWGASGATEQVLIWAAQVGGQIVIEQAVRALIARRGVPTGPIERDQALNAAQQTIVVSRDLAVSDLQLTEETEDRVSNVFSFKFSVDESWVISAEVSAPRGLATVTRVTYAKV